MTYQTRGSIKCMLCDSLPIGRKLCRKHYNQMRKLGKLHDFPIVGPEDVFDSRYKIVDSGCWEWTGHRNYSGYGIFLLPGEVKIRAHRYMYEKTNGGIPDGLIIRHTCDNPCCVNPSHLLLGTKADNNRDAKERRRHHYGTDHWNGRLTDEQVNLIRLDTRPQKIIANEYGVHQSHISKLKSLKHRV